MRKILLFAALVSVLASVGFANIANPDLPAKKKNKSIDSFLSIRLDKAASEARLVIPRSQLKQLRAELEKLDDGDTTDNTAAATFQGTQTIVSGALISLAFVFGGMWFMRSGSKPGKIVVASAVLLSCSVATLVYANAGPPSEANAITGKIFSDVVHQNKFASGSIKLEVSDSTRVMELVVPDSQKKVAD